MENKSFGMEKNWCGRYFTWRLSCEKLSKKWQIKYEIWRIFSIQFVNRSKNLFVLSFVRSLTNECEIFSLFSVIFFVIPCLPNINFPFVVLFSHRIDEFMSNKVKWTAFHTNTETFNLFSYHFYASLVCECHFHGKWFDFRSLRRLFIIIFHTFIGLHSKLNNRKIIFFIVKSISIELTASKRMNSATVKERRRLIEENKKNKSTKVAKMKKTTKCEHMPRLIRKKCRRNENEKKIKSNQSAAQANNQTQKTRNWAWRRCLPSRCRRVHALRNQ